MPSTGSPAMEAACGKWGAARCDAEKWFSYMGDPDQNVYVPYPMNFITDQNENFNQLDSNPKLCSEAYEVTFFIC